MDHVMSDYGPGPAVTVAGLESVASGLPRPPDEAACLSALWSELVSGFCRVEQTEFTAHSCSVRVSRTHRLSGDQRAPLPARDIEILERSLLHGVRKSVAADFGLCPSSVAEILRRCFLFMGLSCWPSRIPLLIVMAAHAKSAAPSARAAKLVLAQNQQFLRQSITVSRPDNELSSVLSPAEFAVTRSLIEGRSYAEVARLRQTSKRTVANQLASGFQRLHISGRAELLCLLARQRAASWQEQPPPSSRSRKPAAPEFAAGLARVAGASGR